ncbi:MAG: hypothetical protein KC729_18130, partial [Candidatus Eisenbacteria bacterium]|nr:hypothetical protein [Candidatus Eisenbacteria bacterium]
SVVASWFSGFPRVSPAGVRRREGAATPGSAGYSKVLGENGFKRAVENSPWTPAPLTRIH